MNTLARKVIAEEEGWREYAYYDSEGFATIGYGFKLSDEKNFPLPDFKLPRSAGIAWLEELIIQIEVSMASRIRRMNPSRKAIILSMCYQLGIAGCLSFKNMWNAIENEDWCEASHQMKDSLWYRQTPERVERHSKVMLKGSTRGVYGF